MGDGLEEGGATENGLTVWSIRIVALPRQLKHGREDADKALLMRANVNIGPEQPRNH